MRWNVLMAAAAAAAVVCMGADSPEWRKPFAAHRVIGNIYYVGTYDLASFLIVTPAGNVLVNGGLADSVPLMKKSVADLGFRWTDIKWMLTTQAHYDHVAAFAEVQRTTGAKVLATAADAELLESGGKTDFHFTGAEYEYAPVKVAERLTDGEVLKFGGTEITVYLHPGHTKGAASYAIPVQEGGRTVRVLIANMASINPGVKLVGNKKYPGIAEDYRRTFEKQKALSCDVFLSSHAGQYGLHTKYKAGDAYDPARFVDPEGYRKGVAAMEAAYRKQLAEEQANGKLPAR
jgi:metallo-beta-lactamase class B